MPETGKQSAPTGTEVLLPRDLSKAISQYLLGLSAAGVSQLPKSTGKYDFSSSIRSAPPTQAASLSKPTAAPATTKLAAQASRAPRDTVAPASVTAVLDKPRPIGKATLADSASEPFYENLPTYGPPVAAEERAGQLKIVQSQVADCTACKELASTRTQTVFGVGNPDARLVFVGEAPGADEDRQGEPFVGAAGQLLTKIIAAMRLGRDDVYILNTLKCRPPGNRNPKDDELRNCAKFSLRQLEIIQPEFICCLGSIAAKTLLNTRQSIGRMRGQIYQWRGSQVVVTYHPAYLLRSPEAKKYVWEDMKLIMREMGLES